MRTAEALPTLRMGSYLAYEALPAEARDGLVPVRVDPIEPVVPLTYEPEVCGLLTPEQWMVGEWPEYSASYWQMLDRLGAGRIADELAAISERHGGKTICLLDHDSPWRSPYGHGRGHGDSTPRTAFAAWWERSVGEPVLELLPDGTTVHPADFPKRVQPVVPKDPKEDRRWRDAPELPWPPTEEDVARWMDAVYWQTARTPNNPHQYNHRAWGPELPFWRVVMWIRETGETEVWGNRRTFRYKRVGDYKLWTMGHALASTIILNRKEWGADPQDHEKDGRESTDRKPAWAERPVEAPLFDRDGRPLSLVERINHEHRACALATGAAVRHAVRCGELLAEAKAGVRHGEWLGWLRENFAGSARTAQKYMRLHQERTTPRTANTHAQTHLETGQEIERRSA